MERARAARAARSSARDRQAAGRGAAALATLLDRRGAALGGDRRAELLAARARAWTAPLLARSDVDQRRLAGVARPRAARLRRAGSRARAGRAEGPGAQRPWRG